MKMYEKTNDSYKEIDLWPNAISSKSCGPLEFVLNSFADILFGKLRA